MKHKPSLSPAPLIRRVGRGLLLAALCLPALSLSGQANQDEYRLLKSYETPKNAVSFDELTEVEGRWLRGETPFTGVAFKRFESGRLQQVFTLHKGLQDGPTYLWYPDGAPLMSANYRAGALQGRFLGWYAHGGVIYDMVLNQGVYGGDNIEDDREQSVQEDGEREGDAGFSDEE